MRWSFIAVLMGLLLWSGLHLNMVWQTPIEPTYSANVRSAPPLEPAWQSAIKQRIQQKKKQQTTAPRTENYGIRTQLSAFVLCLLFGWLGVHRFYTGHFGLGILQLLTFGCCGAFWLVDLFLIILGDMKTANGEPLVPWRYPKSKDTLL